VAHEAASTRGAASGAPHARPGQRQRPQGRGERGGLGRVAGRIRPARYRRPAARSAPGREVPESAHRHRQPACRRRPLPAGAHPSLQLWGSWRRLFPCLSAPLPAHHSCIAAM